MTFSDLNLGSSLLNALADLEYIHPTPIQKEAFPVIMSGKDVIGIAQTGTGKTFAYLLPLLRMHKFSKSKDPRVAIVVPTRELVIQLVGELEKLTKYMTIRVAGVYGGTNINTQKFEVIKGVDIVVSTPGRLMDLNYHGALSLKSVKKLVIDEVDEMLNLGFRPQLVTILDMLPRKRQNLLFSATMTKDVDDLMHTFFNFPVRIEVVPTGTPLEQIIQIGYTVPNFYTKINLLEHLLKTDDSLEKVLVFVGTKKLADIAYELMLEKFPEKVGVIHSNKSQNFRNNVVRQFQESEIRILIATDIIARGLDIDEITHVINIDTSEVPEHYIHRIGRTGRADKVGTAITFSTEAEQEAKQQIEALMKKEIELLPLPDEVVIETKLLLQEKPVDLGDKHYLSEPDLNVSKGAFHDKKESNKKTNRAQEKRIARRNEKKRSRRRKKK